MVKIASSESGCMNSVSKMPFRSQFLHCKMGVIIIIPASYISQGGMNEIKVLTTMPDTMSSINV